MNKFREILFILLIPALSFAQSNYKPGYLVNTKGDTIRGYVNYHEWNKNPSNFGFKKLLKGAAEDYSVKNATAFGINGLEFYKLYNVRISHDQVEMANIKQGVDTSYLMGNVFLHILTSGEKLTLFAYTDDIKTRYYIVNAAEKQPEELVYRVYYSPQNFGLVQTDNRYRVQLINLAQRYNLQNTKLNDLIATAQYTETDLVKTIQIINGVTNKQFTPASRLGVGWFAGLGFVDDNVYFKGAIKFNNSSSLFPKVSAGFNLFTNKNTQQLFFRVEASYTASTHSFSNPPDNTGYSSSLQNVKRSTISLSPQAFYNFYNTDGLKMFISAGASINISAYGDYSYHETFSNVASTSTHKFPDFSSFWYALPLKTGIIINKKIEIYAGYTFPVILTRDYDTFAAYVYNYQAGINYLFGAK